MSLDNDLSALVKALAPVKTQAARLPWAKERRWTPKTHLGRANGLPVIDLHDLSVRLALEVIAIAQGLSLSTGGYILITGRGRHTGGHSKLRKAVLADLEERVDAEGLTFKPLDPGRIEVVCSAERVKSARPGMGLLFWLFVALLIAGILASIFG